MKEAIQDLDNQVTTLEKDNSALNNTIKLVSTSNHQFRQHTIIGIMTGMKKQRIVFFLNT